MSGLVRNSFCAGAITLRGKVSHPDIIIHINACYLTNLPSARRCGLLHGEGMAGRDTIVINHL